MKPVPTPAVISSGLPENVLKNVMGLSVSTRDTQGRKISTVISPKAFAQRLHKEDKSIISPVFAPSARSSTEPAALRRFGQPGAESRVDLFCLGQRMRVRSVVGNRWQMGRVASEVPLLIQPQGEAFSSLFMHV